MIALVLELSGVPSLAFAVGVYLPLVVVRADLRRRPHPLAGRPAHAQRSPSTAAWTRRPFVAESDQSPGVLLASGYIAGGAIAGIVIAFLAGVLGDLDAALQRWSTANNPFLQGRTRTCCR